MDGKARLLVRPSEMTSPFSQKTFLRAVRTLDELRKEMKRVRGRSKELDMQADHKFGRLFYFHRLPATQYRMMYVYYRRLKRMLSKWYLLMMTKESAKTMDEHRTFLRKFWAVAGSECESLKSFPRTQHGAFLDDAFVGVSNLKKMSEALRCTLQDDRSVVRSFSNATSIIDCGFAPSHFFRLRQTLAISTSFVQELFCVVCFCLQASFYKFSRTDPSSMSVEFITSVLRTCESFKKFFSCYGARSSFTSRGSSEPFFGMLTSLSHFQGKVAAEKMVQGIVAAAHGVVDKLKGVTVLGVLSSQSNVNRNPDWSSTSDYYSASTSDIINSGEGSLSLPAVKEQLTDMFTAVLSRNQALVLKIMCAVRNVTADKVSGDAPGVKNETESPGVWKRPKSRSQDVTTAKLEKAYWLSFWSEMSNFVLKMLVDVPQRHQFGEFSLGSIILLNESHLNALLIIFQAAAEIVDIPAEFQNSLMKMNISVHAFISQMLWDSSMCMALKNITCHHCTAVPLTGGKVGTHATSSFSCAFQSASSVLCNGQAVKTATSISLQALNRMVFCLDVFYGWAVTKERAFLSSWDISSFLLITHSEILEDCQLSRLQHHCDMKFYERPSYLLRTFMCVWHSFMLTSENVKSLPTEATRFLCEKIKLLISEDLFSDRSVLCLQRVAGCRTNSGIQLRVVIEEILEPVYESARCIVTEAALKPFTEEVLITTVQVFLYLFHKKRRRSLARFCNMNVPNGDLPELLSWVDQLSFSEDEKEDLKALACIKELSEVSNVRPRSSFLFWRSKRRVRPFPT